MMCGRSIMLALVDMLVLLCEFFLNAQVWITLIVMFLVQQPPMGHGFLIHEVSRSHTTTKNSR